MKQKITISLLILSVFLSSCAGSYKLIRPKGISYTSSNSAPEVELSYKYDMLQTMRNKKYAKKENKAGIKVVAVKITNNSSQSLKLGGNLSLYANGQPVIPMEPMAVYHQLKQGVAIYVLYLPLTFLRLNFYNTDSYGRTTVTSSIPIGYAIGPGIAFGNMLTAGSSNKHFREELLRYNLIGKEIKPGETAYGLVSIHSHDYSPLSLQITE